MYKEYIKRKFPHSPELDLYVAPKLPGSKLGKVLTKVTRVQSPGDVAAFYYSGGFFGSEYVILTDKNCYHGDGEFLLEDLRGVHIQGENLTVQVNHLGQITDQVLKFGSTEAAETFRKGLNDLKYYDPAAEAAPPPSYEGFDGAELDWLKLRDEVLKTIDVLAEKFNDGKLSLLEYETKKEQLLARL